MNQYSYKELLSQKLKTIFLDEKVRLEVISILDNYGIETYEGEPERVRLAILKLSENDVDQVRQYTDWAKQDYRDILSWAEYPNQNKESSIPSDRRKKLIDLDRLQYEAWLFND